MKLTLSKSYELLDERPIAWGDGQTLWIAPISDHKYQEHMNAFVRWAQAQQNGFRSSATREAALDKDRTAAAKEGAAKYLIRRWEGVKDVETGEEVPYRPELGLELMNDAEAGDAFFVDVIGAASQTEAYRLDRQRATEKNSPALSDSGGASESTSQDSKASSSGSSPKMAVLHN